MSSATTQSFLPCSHCSAVATTEKEGYPYLSSALTTMVSLLATAAICNLSLQIMGSQISKFFRKTPVKPLDTSLIFGAGLSGLLAIYKIGKAFLKQELIGTRSQFVKLCRLQSSASASAENPRPQANSLTLLVKRIISLHCARAGWNSGFTLGFVAYAWQTSSLSTPLWEKFLIVSPSLFTLHIFWRHSIPTLKMTAHILSEALTTAKECKKLEGWLFTRYYNYLMKATSYGKTLVHDETDSTDQTWSLFALSQEIMAAKPSEDVQRKHFAPLYRLRPNFSPKYHLPLIYNLCAPDPNSLQNVITHLDRSIPKDHHIDFIRHALKAFMEYDDKDLLSCQTQLEIIVSNFEDRILESRPNIQDLRTRMKLLQVVSKDQTLPASINDMIHLLKEDASLLPIIRNYPTAKKMQQQISTGNNSMQNAYQKPLISTLISQNVINILINQKLNSLEGDFLTTNTVKRMLAQTSPLERAKITLEMIESLISFNYFNLYPYKSLTILEGLDNDATSIKESEDAQAMAERLRKAALTIIGNDKTGSLENIIEEKENE